MIDCSRDFNQYVTHKFGKNCDIVDEKEIRIFSGGGTGAQIKCSLGVNPHGVREKIINKNKTDKCPVCGTTEN